MTEVTNQFIVDFATEVSPEKYTNIARLLKTDAQFEWKRGETVALILKKLISIWKQCLDAINKKSEIAEGKANVTVVNLLANEESPFNTNYLTAEQCIKTVTEIMKVIIADLDLVRWMANAARHKNNVIESTKQMSEFVKSYNELTQQITTIGVQFTPAAAADVPGSAAR